ncbi:uncharacterized protein V1513DRAFT_185651 [Lipomyces chichibuensis]|uniref:uncharacterized protein n=1 Tax=Lipomyces chichibuensis TaxID=1546026 RepID=UPI003343B48D
MFSTPQQNQPSTSLFGSSAKPSTPVFGAQSGTTNTGLFGAPTQQTNQPSTGLFGNKTAATTNTSGLFGSTTNTTGGAQSFSFGATAPAAQNTGTGLFGASTTSKTGTGLFGGSAAANTSTTSAPSLFSNPSAPTTSSANLFGNPQGSTNIALSGTFGANPNATSNPLGGSLFGKPVAATQPQQQQPQAPQQITSLTRYSDLPESAQKELDEIDNYINKQTEISEDLKARKNSWQDELQSVPRDVEVVMRKLVTTHQALSNDLVSTTSLRTIVDTATQDAQLCIQILQQLRIPGARLPPGDPLLAYFERYAIELEKKIADCKGVLGDVDHAVGGLEREILEGQSAGGGAEGVLRALREEYAVFMALGNRVAELHHAVARLESREK